MGCDGGRSLVRKAAGIAFPGWDPSTSSLIAEVEMREEPEVGIRRDEQGVSGLNRLEDGERVGVVVREEHARWTGEPTLDDLSRGARRRLLGMDEPRRRFAAMMSGLDIHYDLGAGHPLLGRRMPDLELVTAGGPLRVFSLLHEARAVLLDLGGRALVLPPWAEPVQHVEARHAGVWELPVVGAVAALATWFGPPSVVAVQRRQQRP